MSTIRLLSSADFPEHVLRAATPVLLDFGSKTCGVCLANAPAVATVAAEYEGDLSVWKVDVEETPDLAETYGVRTLPTLLMFWQGAVTGKLMGHQTRSSLARFVEQQIEAAA